MPPASCAPIRREVRLRPRLAEATVAGPRTDDLRSPCDCPAAQFNTGHALTEDVRVSLRCRCDLEAIDRLRMRSAGVEHYGGKMRERGIGAHHLAPADLGLVGAGEIADAHQAP